ncbi:MAG TPA: PadR family transcriptional regulator [Solirubrobacteraceae bacterium]
MVERASGVHARSEVASTASGGGAESGAKRDLVPGEWAVLGLLAEGPAHGFALCKALAPGGAIGEVWSVPRALVYRTLGVLEDRELVQATATESGPGPVRTILSITPAGRALLERWLDEPVEHVRDARSLLMLKLAFIDRSGRDPRLLLERQRALMHPLAEAHRERVATLSDWPHTVELWRYECVEAVIRFTEQMLAGGAGRR